MIPTQNRESATIRQCKCAASCLLNRDLVVNHHGLYPRLLNSYSHFCPNIHELQLQTLPIPTKNALSIFSSSAINVLAGVPPPRGFWDFRLVHENSEPMSFGIEVQLRSLLLPFVQGEISIDECKRKIGLLVPSTKVLDRLNIILKMPGNPLTSRSPNHKESARLCRQAWTDTEDNRLLCGMHRYGLQDLSLR
jgi:hypothetical protein